MSSNPSQPQGAPAAMASAAGGARKAARPRPAAASDPLVRRRKVAHQLSRPSPSTNATPKPAAQNSNASSLLSAAGPDPATSGPYEDIPLFVTKRQLLEGLKYHVMRFAPGATSYERDINPSNDKQFVPPVRLQRRDPRNDPKYADDGDEEDEKPEAPVDDKDRERQAAAKAERQAIREANLAQIAPVDKAQPNKKKAAQRKTEQVFRPGGTEERQKNWEQRYEEAVPWHIEGFDDKQIWRGIYEYQLSNNHVMLQEDTSSSGQKMFRLVPITKWYRFTHRSSKAKILQPDEAEARFLQPFRVGKFEQHMELKRKQALVEAREARVSAKLRKGERGETNVRDVGDRGDDVADVDDIDYDYAEAFADDEEAVHFETQDEQSKEAQEKVKREQMKANIFAMKEAKDEHRDYDKEEEEAKTQAEQERKLGKRTEKALKKQEKNYLYEEDSADENPYASKSESEDSEEERLREEESRKKVAEDGKAAAAATAAGEAGGAGDGGMATAPSSQTGAPPGRPSKLGDGLRGASKKRPSSPNGSDLSGNESSRKKTKRTHAAVQVGTSQPPSRPMSPANAGGLRVNAANKKVPSNQGSDTEMSDGQGGKKKKKTTIKLTSGKASPAMMSPDGSRAGSPAAAGTSTAAATASAKNSGVKQNTALPSASQEDIITLLKQFPEGLEIQSLATELNTRMQRKLLRTTIPFMKNLVKFDKTTRRLTLKAEGALSPGSPTDKV